MLTRRAFGLSNVNIDENANLLKKNVIPRGKSEAVNARTRTVLGEIENVGGSKKISCFKKPDTVNKVVPLAKLITSKVLSPLRLNLTSLTSDQIEEYFSFCEKRRNNREVCLKLIELQDFIDIDNDSRADSASVSAFAESIFNYLQNIEFICQPLSSGFLGSHTDVTPRMRYILVNWLVQVHQSYKLQPETLYLCIAIIDRYLQKAGSKVSKEKFQLVGVTALFIASKFEEMYPPEISDFSSITDNSFSKRDIRTHEQLILQTLDFYLSIPTPIVFLRRISRVLQVDRRVHNLAKYFLELTVQEYDLAYLSANLRATLASCLALAVSACSDDIAAVWSVKLAYVSGYSIDDIREPLKILAKAVYRQNSPSQYRAIYDKYRLDDVYDRVASLPQLRSTIMEKLANLKFDDSGNEVVFANT